MANHTFQPPRATLHTLANVDGSATYTSANNTHTITVGVNYPVEVPYRSDEVPESTYIEVNLRPHNGVDLVKEHHIEHLVTKTLRSIVMGEETPRTMLQVTLQVTSMEVDEGLPGGVKGGGQGETYLDLLVGAVNASVLGCLDAGVQMRCFAGAALVGIKSNGQPVMSPRVEERNSCQSLHVLAFTSKGECILIESEGRCKLAEWKRVQVLAREAVLGVETGTGSDVDMNGSDVHASSTSVTEMMRKSVQVQVTQTGGWQEP